MTATVASQAPPLTPVNDTGALITLSAQGAGTTQGNNNRNNLSRGVKVIVNITAISGTAPTLTVTLQGVDVASGALYTILASAALTATGTTVLTVFPGATAAANVAANDALPANWALKAVIGGTGPSVTATIGASVLA